MYTNISVFIVLNKCKFCVVNYSSKIRGYFVSIFRGKWGAYLDMNETSFNKYLPGELVEDCVYGKWEPGLSSEEDHWWETTNCSINSWYLTLCQELLSKCIGFAQKWYRLGGQWGLE